MSPRRLVALPLSVALAFATTASSAAEKKPEGETSSLVWVGFGIAGVGLAVGTLFGADSIHATNTAKERCDGARCPPSAFEFIDQANTSAWISNVSFGVAAIGAGIGIWGLVKSSGPAKPPGEERPSPHPAPPGISLQLGPGAFALRGTF